MEMSKINNILGSIKKIDVTTYYHLERTAMFTFALARELKFKAKQLEEAYFAGLLHDVGVLSYISRDKKECAEIGSTILEFIDDSGIIFKAIKHLNDYHLQEESYITLLSEITALSSEYDELIYSKKLEHIEALDILKKMNFKIDMLQSFDEVLKKEELI